MPEAVPSTINVDNCIPVLHHIISSINKHLLINRDHDNKDFYLGYSQSTPYIHKLYITYNGSEIGHARFSFKKVNATSELLIMSITPMIDVNHRRKHYFLWLHNTLCLFGHTVSPQGNIEMHYKTQLSAVFHTIFKYYNPTAIHSARTGEVISDRETISLYQQSANNIPFLERLGEIDLIIPCNAENAGYARIINDWLIHKGGLQMPMSIVIL